MIQEYEVNTPGLPNSLDGTVIIALSDLHLGSQLENVGWQAGSPRSRRNNPTWLFCSVTFSKGTDRRKMS